MGTIQHCFDTAQIPLSPIGYSSCRGRGSSVASQVLTLVGGLAGEARSWPGSHWVWEGTPEPVQSDKCGQLHPSRADTYVTDAAMSPSSEGRTQPPSSCLLFHRDCGVGGPHRTTTLITVSVLRMPRLQNQQVDLSWISDICDRADNVRSVKVTDEGEILDQSRGRSTVFQPLPPDWPANLEFSRRTVAGGMQSPCPSC